jgi:hypothetical protein
MLARELLLCLPEMWSDGSNEEPDHDHKIKLGFKRMELSIRKTLEMTQNKKSKLWSDLTRMRHGQRLNRAAVAKGQKLTKKM